ncbi:MAG: FecR family protein [Ignavibacteriaceae bacterium]
MNEERFIELVTKYLSNEASVEERNELNTLLEEEKYFKKFELIQSKWNEIENPIEYAQFDVKRGLAKLNAKIQKYETNHIRKRKERTLREFVHTNTLLKIAASIAILILLATGTLYISGVFKQSPIALTWNEKVTDLGHKSIITLNDGTKITLNADSKLKFPTKFESKKREVYLEGEAYFEVAHDSIKPFIVHSGKFSTTVLGTKFDVKAFPNENDFTVSLVKGKVRVSKTDSRLSNNEIILTPDQQFIYDKTTGTEKIDHFDYLQTVGWKDNILIFDNIPLEKALVQLDRYFGVKFELADNSYGSLKIKGNFKNESFWTIVKVIKYATGLAYKTISKGNKIQEINFYKQ